MKQTYSEMGLGPNWEKAFQVADIRGVCDQEINEALAYRVARSFVVLFKIPTMVVGCDMRLSSPAIKAAFIAGARIEGATVLDIGMVTSPMVYFMSGSEHLHAVMITASHNPANYNGLKLVLPRAIPLTNKTGLSAIKKKVKENVFQEKVQVGELKKRSILKSYEQYVLSKISPHKPRLRIVVDAGNGMSTLLIPLLRKYASVTPLFAELDGTFPNRDSNPTLKKSQKQITAFLQAGDFDLGVAFDGDGDRVAFFDEHGRYINAAHVGAFLAQAFLPLQPQARFVYTTLNSRIFSETIKSGGGKAIRAKVGHNFMKEQMRLHDAYFGCENSGHYYFKDNFYADSGILTVVNVLQAVTSYRTTGSSISSVFSPFAKYTQTEEVFIRVKDKDQTLREFGVWMEKIGARVTHFDGVIIDAGEWWASIKKSVTEDGLKFVVESATKKMALARQKEILEFLKLHA